MEPPLPPAPGPGPGPGTGPAKMLLGKLDKVGSDFRSLFLDPETADVLVVCGPETLVAHRAVLLARSRRGFFGPRNSKRWRKRSTNGVTIDVLELNELDPTIVTKVLEYVYAGMVAVEPEQLLPVAIAADYLQVEGLSYMCAEKLVGTATLENAFENLDVLTGHSATLKPAIDSYIRFIGENARDLLDCEDILMLRENAMLTLLQSDYLACPEEEIFESFLKWGLHNCEMDTMDPAEWPSDKHEKLRQYLSSTAPCIRLKLMSPKYLLEVVEPTMLFSPEDLMAGYRSRCLELSRRVGELESPGGKYWLVYPYTDKLGFDAELKDFDPRSFSAKEFLESPKTPLGESSFCANIKFYPKGLDETDPDPSAGLYLKVTPADGARVPPNWHVFVKYRLILNDGSISRASSQSNGTDSAKAVTHTFSASSLDWGYKKFTKLTRIVNMLDANKTKSLAFQVVISEFNLEPSLEDAVVSSLAVSKE